MNTEHGEEVGIHNLHRDGTRRSAGSRENDGTEGLFRGLSVECNAVEQSKPSEEDMEAKSSCVEDCSSFPPLVDGAAGNTVMDWINEYTKEKVYVRPLVVYPSQRVNLAHNYEGKNLFHFSRYQGANTTVGRTVLQQRNNILNSL